MNAVIDESKARHNLAVNVYCRLQDMDKPYFWLANELGVYASRIQKILEQTCCPNFAIVLNMADVLGLSVEQLSATPSAKDVARYRAKYPELEKVA